MTTLPRPRCISRGQAVFSWIGVIMFSMCMFRESAGLALRPCDESGKVEVVDNTDFFFTCDEYSGGSVTWSYMSDDKVPDVIGTCGPSSCVPSDIIPTGFFILFYLTEASSRLTVTSTTTNRTFGGTYIRCGTSIQCQVDIVSPAALPANSLNFTTTHWNLQGSIAVTSVYSSLDRYSCAWTETNWANKKTNISSVSLSLAPDTSVRLNRTGRCSFSKQLPSDPGTYNYTVVINPGNTQRTGGFMTIERPQSPVVYCNPTGHVPENNVISCTCSTGNMGQPKGRLVWVRSRNINNPINAGIYGATSLIMTPQTLIRADHNSTIFNCDVEWIQNVTGQTYTVLVGYGPSQPTFIWNSSKTEENQTLSFHCKAEGRPTPNITLIHQDSGAVLASQQSPLLWLVSRGQCKDGGVYTCSAGNAMGPDTQTNVTVNVTCRPREVELNSGVPNRPILNFKDAPLLYVFSMTAYPAPTSFSVTFIGVDMTFTSPERNVTGINFNVFCQQRSRPLYIASCTLTVSNVTSATAAGFYRLTLTNDEGSGDFVFQVKINATEGGSGAPDVNAGAIAGGVVAAVIVVVVVVVVVVVIIRRKQGTDGGGGEGGTDEYAVVNKGNKVPVAASAQPPDTYAVVNKGKKAAQTGRTPDNKAKTSMPDKQQNRNLEHSAAGNTDHEYSNMALSMVPLTNKADTISDDKHSRQTAGGGGRQTNKDGPTYTTVDFTSPAGQQSAQSAPPPAAHSVLYSEVVFNQATPTH